MATMREHHEIYGWWINELESLGLSVKKINEFNHLDEMRDLAEIIKQDKYVDYKTDYFSDGNLVARYASYGILCHNYHKIF